jgi:chloramphenicol-sensitive protein RarD
VNTGILYALGAYLIWGLLPLYLHVLAPVGTIEILAHRIVWSLATVAVLLVALRRLSWIGPALRRPATLLPFVATATLISCNWIIYIWSINSGHVIDSSLGYFINPLVNVLLGALLLKERLRLGQKVPVAVAGIGVAWLTWQAGAPPWIGLALALSFSLYGLLRKTASLGALEGFTVEAAVLTPIAMGYLAWEQAQGSVGFSHASSALRILLVGAGPVTAIPLLLFAAGARRIPFSLLGVLQYLAPTIQWLSGIFFFREPFDPHKSVGFGLIWLALLLYAAESLWFGRWVSRNSTA